VASSAGLLSEAAHLANPLAACELDCWMRACMLTHKLHLLLSNPLVSAVVFSVLLSAVLDSA
jgi:hypothetical protein